MEVALLKQGMEREGGERNVSGLVYNVTDCKISSCIIER